MIMNGTIAFEGLVYSKLSMNFSDTENLDLNYINKIDELISKLKKENLLQKLESITSLYKQILGNYDEKIMIDGQIHTLKQLVQIDTQLKNATEPNLKELNMLYLSIYRLDQQIQIDRYVPLFKEIVGERFNLLTLGDLNEELPFANGKTGMQLVKDIQQKADMSLPTNQVEQFVRNAIISNAQTVEEIEKHVLTEAKKVDVLLAELGSVNKNEERLNILNNLPLQRFHVESLEVQKMVVEKLVNLDQDALANFTQLQRFIVLETIKSKNELNAKELSMQEKTVEQKLSEQAMMMSNKEVVTTVSL